MAIDPYPVLGDRAFDVGHSLSRRDLLDAREQVTLFADRLDLDARRIAGWTFACCVELALECRSVGDAMGLRECLGRTEQLSSQREQFPHFFGLIRYRCRSISNCPRSAEG